MTKQEFIDYVERYGKEPGTFTSDEIYQLGLMFKSLPAVDKRWSWFIELLGIEDRTPEGVRVGINKRYNRELLHGVPGSFSFNNQQEQLYVAKQKVRDQLNDYRRMLRDTARVDEFQELLFRELKNIPSYPKLEPTRIKTFNNKKTAILMLSDWHIGQENDNYKGKYNYEIAVKRVEKLVADVKYYVEINKVNSLEVLLLGDFFEGFINTNARITQEMDVCSQIIKSAELICDLLYNLQNVAKKVTVRGCSDNHSRVFKDTSQSIAKENLFRIQDWFIQERLKDTRIIFPNDNLDDYLGMFELECGKVVAFEHGHLIKRNAFQQLIPIKKGTWIDIVCLGHYHSSSALQNQSMKIYYNGSLCNAGDYSNSLHLFAEPEQKLLIVDEHNTIDIDIGFDI